MEERVNNQQEPKKWPQIHDPLVCGIIGRDCDDCEAEKERKAQEDRRKVNR